jgi:hypothetical protein
MLQLLKISLLLLFTSLLGACYNDASRERRLVEHGIKAKAIVSVDSCDKLVGIKYDFAVDGKNYRGTAPWPEHNCHNTNLGESVTIVYDPRNPASNTMADPQALYDRALGWYMPPWLLVPLLFVGIVIVVIVQARLREEPLRERNAPSTQGAQEPR